MNIKTFLPKNVNLDDVKSRAITYKGTFDELVSLVNEDKVTLVTEANGAVTGIWVDSGTNDLMIDELSGRNFQSAYSYSNVMNWLEIILNAKSKGYQIENIDLNEGTCVINTEVVRFAPAKHVATASCEDLPSEVTISSDVEDVKNYLRKTYRHCLARGSSLNLRYSSNEDGTTTVSNIQWGRKLTDSELANI